MGRVLNNWALCPKETLMDKEFALLMLLALVAGHPVAAEIEAHYVGNEPTANDVQFVDYLMNLSHEELIDFFWKAAELEENSPLQMHLETWHS
jgi:hypothetical protein